MAILRAKASNYECQELRLAGEGFPWCIDIRPRPTVTVSSWTGYLAESRQMKPR